MLDNQRKIYYSIFDYVYLFGTIGKLTCMRFNGAFFVSVHTNKIGGISIGKRNQKDQQTAKGHHLCGE